MLAQASHAARRSGGAVAALALLLAVLGTSMPDAEASATISQVGGDIDGEVGGDRSGESVSFSSDGSRVAIGADENDETGTTAGHVRVYDWNGSAWEKLGSDIDGEATGDQSGTSVALSSDGSRVAIGAYQADGTAGSNAGHVRVYEYDAEAGWTQLGSDIDGEATGDQSGSSVALSSDGSRVAIGARFNDGTGTVAGHVRVYDWDGSAWVQVGGDIDGEAADDRSGTSVALSSDGSRVAIGAVRNDGTGADAGHVRVFDLDGSAWVQVGGDIDGEAADDRSGTSVALSSDGSRVAIGAVQNDGTGADAGHVRVFAIASAVESSVVPNVVSRLAVSCAPAVPSAGVSVACAVTGGDPDIDILWRATYNPVFAEAGVTLDDTGSGEFAFVVPAEAVGQELTVELVEWLAPMSLGVVGGPVPSSVPSGGGPPPVWWLVMLLLAGGLLLRRVATVGVRG